MYIRSEPTCVVFIPESKRHGIKAPVNFAEERTGSFHLQAVLLTGVPLINGGPQTSISGLIVNEKSEKTIICLFIINTFGSNGYE